MLIHRRYIDVQIYGSASNIGLVTSAGGFFATGFVTEAGGLGKPYLRQAC